jgi:hypothetical protein
LELQITAADPRRPPPDKFAKWTRDRPGTARFQPRREESGSITEKVILDRAPPNSYAVAALIRVVSPTICQRGAMVLAYRIEQSGPASFQRGGLQVGSSGSVPIPIVCDASGHLIRPLPASVVEVTPQ